MRKLSFSIRYGYRPDEIPRLREIERECFEHGVGWNLKEFKENLPTTQVWVAEAAGSIAGFLLATIDRKVPNIESIDVAKNFRSHGIGAALIAACEEYYRALGYERITLLVHTDNPAQMLYFKQGFRVVRFYRDCEYGSKRKNMLLMQKVIKA